MHVDVLLIVSKVFIFRIQDVSKGKQGKIVLFHTECFKHIASLPWSSRPHPLCRGRQMICLQLLIIVRYFTLDIFKRDVIAYLSRRLSK